MPAFQGSTSEAAAEDPPPMYPTSTLEAEEPVVGLCVLLASAATAATVRSGRELDVGSAARGGSGSVGRAAGGSVDSEPELALRPGTGGGCRNGLRSDEFKVLSARGGLGGSRRPRDSMPASVSEATVSELLAAAVAVMGGDTLSASIPAAASLNPGCSSSTVEESSAAGASPSSLRRRRRSSLASISFCAAEEGAEQAALELATFWLFTVSSRREPDSMSAMLFRRLSNFICSSFILMVCYHSDGIKFKGSSARYGYD